MAGPEDRLDGLYASELGCAPEDFHSGRIVTVSHATVAEIRFAKGVPLALFSIARAGGAVVSVHPRLIEAADRAVDGRLCPDETFDALERVLTPLIKVEYWFRGCRLYCGPETFSDRSSGEVRDVTGQDETAAALHAKWGGPVFGQIVEGKAVAWAAVKPLSAIAWDLSVQTAPGHRGKGYASSVVSVAVKHILGDGKLATWGTDTTNIASLRTARSVGFQDYGLDFGCVERIP